jgi:hypothetical protein
MSEYITTTIKIINVLGEKVRDFNTLAASITIMNLNLQIKITKANLDSRINIMLYSEDLSIPMSFKSSSCIDYFISEIENNPTSLIHLFTKHNDLIFFSLEDNIYDFTRIVLNYLFEVIERPDLKEYYKLKYV